MERFFVKHETDAPLDGWQVVDSVTHAITHAGGHGDDEKQAMVELCGRMNALAPDAQETIVRRHLEVAHDG